MRGPISSFFPWPNHNHYRVAPTKSMSDGHVDETTTTPQAMHSSSGDDGGGLSMSSTTPQVEESRASLPAPTAQIDGDGARETAGDTVEDDGPQQTQVEDAAAGVSGGGK